jgi:hypothetical protein
MELIGIQHHKVSTFIVQLKSNRKFYWNFYRLQFGVENLILEKQLENSLNYELHKLSIKLICRSVPGLRKSYFRLF